MNTLVFNSPSSGFIASTYINIAQEDDNGQIITLIFTSLSSHVSCSAEYFHRLQFVLVQKLAQSKTDFTLSLVWTSDDCHFEAGKSVAKYREDDRLHITESIVINENIPKNIVLVTEFIAI